MSEKWKLWKPSRSCQTASLVLRYLLAVMIVMAAVLLTLNRPVLKDSPYLFLLGAVIVSSLWGGLGPGFLATALSTLFIRLFFIEPRLSVLYVGNSDDAERLGWFVLVTLMTCSLVAAGRRERNLLRDSEDRYRILAETASDAIIVIDETGEIVFVNPVAETTFGTPAEKLLGQNLASLFPEDLYQTHLAEVRRHVDTRKKAVAVQLSGRHQSGRHILVEMTLGAVTRHGKNLFTAILKEVIEPKGVQHVHL